MLRWVFMVRFLLTAVMEQRKKNFGFSSSEFGVSAVRNITFWLVERAHLIQELLRQEKSIWTGIICYLHKVVLLLTAKGFTPFSYRHFSNRLYRRLSTPHSSWLLVKALGSSKEVKEPRKWGRNLQGRGPAWALVTLTPRWEKVCAPHERSE